MAGKPCGATSDTPLSKRVAGGMISLTRGWYILNDSCWRIFAGRAGTSPQLSESILMHKGHPEHPGLDYKIWAPRIDPQRDAPMAYHLRNLCLRAPFKSVVVAQDSWALPRGNPTNRTCESRSWQTFSCHHVGHKENEPLEVRQTCVDQIRDNEDRLLVSEFDRIPELHVHVHHPSSSCGSEGIVSVNPARRLDSLSLNKPADFVVGGSVSGQFEPRLRDQMLQVRLVLLNVTSRSPSGAIPNVLRPSGVLEGRNLSQPSLLAMPPEPT